MNRTVLWPGSGRAHTTIAVGSFFIHRLNPLTLEKREERIEGKGGVVILDYLLLVRGIKFLGNFTLHCQDI